MAGIDAKDWFDEKLAPSGNLLISGGENPAEELLPFSTYLIGKYCPAVLFIDEKMRLVGSNSLPTKLFADIPQLPLPLSSLFDSEDLLLFETAIHQVLKESMPVRKYGQLLRKGSNPTRVDLMFSLTPISLGNCENKIIELAVWESPLAATTITTSEEQLQLDKQLRVLNQELRRSNETLSQSNSYLNRFVYGAAHDLRSPLVVLKSYVDLIKRFKDEQKREEALDNMKTATIRFENVVNGLVELVELQKTDQCPTEELQFNRVYEMVCFQLEIEIEKAKPQIKTDFSNAPSINFVKSYLNSILYNLLSNAIKYRKEGVPVEIDVKTVQDGEYILLSVVDNGIGMDIENYGDQLYEPFRRLTSKDSGLGIGLNLVNDMVGKNAGKIEVESQLEKGTTFRVYLRPYSNELL